MNDRKWIKLSTLSLCIAALGLVYCGEETTEEQTPTNKDGGTLPTPPDGGSNPGTDAGQVTPDAGTNPGTDGGIVLNELQNVSLKDVRANPGTYYDTSTRKTKAIVNINGAVVVSNYAHSQGERSLYIEQGTGSEKAGILVWYKPKTGETSPAVGSVVDVRGCVNTFWSVVQLQYCGDGENTQVAFSNVQAGSVPALTAGDKFASTELAGDNNAHDDHLGLRVQVDGDITVENAQADECKGTNGQFFCMKLSNGAYMKTAFVHKCDASLLTGTYTNLVGAWDWYESGSNKFRTIVPFTCDDLTAAKP